MTNRFYYDPRINIESIAAELEHMFVRQGYQVQHFGNRDQMSVQMKKGGDLVALIGMQTALTVTMQRSPKGMLAMTGQQKWVDKAVVGAVGLVAAPILWPLAITAGVGAIQQVNLENQVMNALDMLVRQQNPNVQVGPMPPEMMPRYQQAGAPPTSHKVACANCQALNDAGDSYCMRCGHALASQEPQKTLCPNCGAEAKAGATFCTKCGTSLAQQEERAQQSGAQ